MTLLDWLACLRHRCKVMTPMPSVSAISLCGFPCLAKSFACASFVATSTLEWRLAIAACPPQPLRASLPEQPRQLLFFGQTCAFVDKLSDKQRCDLRVNESGVGRVLTNAGHWAEYPRPWQMMGRSG